MEAIHRDYRERGFAVIEIIYRNVQGYNPTLEDLQDWVETYQLTTVVLGDQDRRVWGTYDIHGFGPQDIVIGRDGIIYRHSGFNESEIRQVIESLL